MIFEILFALIFGVLGVLLSFLPGYDVSSGILYLPFGIDEILVLVSSAFHGAIESFPYLQAVLVALLAVVSFEIVVIVLRLFIGHRTPVSTN